jgi:hypothetical protein
MLLCATAQLENYKVKAGQKMSNLVTFDRAELAHVSTRTAKNGNPYASGIIILRNESGGFEASLKFRSFNAVEVLRALELQHFAPSAAQPDTTGGDLAFDDREPESTDTRNRTAVKTAERPRINVAGWFKTTKSDKGNWDTGFIVESVSI